MNKILLGFGVSVCVMLSATQAVNYTFKAATPKAVLHAVELGMNKSTAQAMYDDGVDAKDIKPRFVSAWKKDKQGQVGGAKQFKALQTRMNNPLLKQAFAVMSSDMVKQKLLEKERMVQLKSGNNNKRGSFSLPEIKQMMSNEQFMAYTDMLWHRRTSQALLKLPKVNNKTINATLSVGDGCAFPNIPTALNFANDGDSIIVQAKTFNGLDAQLSISNKNVTIIGGYDSACQVFTANRTILQMDLAGPVVDIDVTGGKTVELFGLDISGSQTDGTDYTSGVNITGDGNVTISNTHIHDNESKFGGGISIQNGADVTVDQNTEIYSNHVTDNGGGIYCDSSSLRVDDTLIGRFNGVSQGNTTDLNGLGGGVYTNLCTASFGAISGPVEISYNNAHSGGAIYLNGSAAQLQHKDSRIAFNEGGSIVSIKTGSSLSLLDAQISDNLNNVSVLIVGNNSDLAVNSSCSNTPCVEITRNEGSVIFVANNAIVEIEKTIISNNTGSRLVTSNTIGGTSVTIKNSRIDNNAAELLFDINSLNGAASTLTLEHVTIANNPGTNAIVESVNNSMIDIKSSIIWGNGQSDLKTASSASVSVSDSVIQFNPAGMANTIQQDPLFIDAVANNFHIQRTSPAIDHAVSAIVEDIDGDVRPLGFGKEAGMDEYSDLVGINGAACNYTTVSQAIAAASNTDTIYISKGTYTEQLGLVDKDLDFVSAIDDCSAVDLTATKTDVTIDGNNQFSLQGGILEVAENRSISFSNMSLKNAQAKDGGIIGVGINSTLILTDVNASNGTLVIPGEGGIIGSGPTSSHIILNGDTAIFSGIAIAQGGGIATAGSLTMNDTSHVGIQDFGNISQDGGGVYCHGCTFIMNDNSSIYANMTMDDDGEGGGVYAVLLSTVILNNESSIGSGFDSLANRAAKGGGLYLIGPSMGVMQDNSKIQHNLTTGSGAGVYLIGGAIIDMFSGSIEFNRIDPDVGDSLFGVGIYSAPDPISRTLTVGTNFFIRNNIMVDFDGETSGGGISIDGSETTLIVNGTVRNNQISSVGAGIAVLNSAHLQLNQAKIIANTSSVDGGGIWLSAGSDVILNDTELTNNTASNNGGGIYASNANITINGNNGGSLFNTNTGVNSKGGGIYADNNSVVIIDGNVNFTANRSTQGGAMYLLSSTMNNTATVSGSLTIENSTNGGADLGGAGIYSLSSNMTIKQASFAGNTTTQNGGALNVNGGIVSIEDSQFNQNSANAGGAIYHNGGILTITASQMCLDNQIAPNYCSQMTGNSATARGSVFALETNSNLIVKHSVIHNNPTNVLGAINLNSNFSNARLENSLLFSNGNTGIVTLTAGTIDLMQVTMENSGLSINALNPQTTISNSIFWNTVVNVPGGTPGDCNITPNGELTGTMDDPMFYTSLKGPYHLDAGSPAVDQCADDISTDLDGRGRPIDSIGVVNLGFENDKGAFERPKFNTLNVTLSGMGAVESSPFGIDCGADCSEDYEQGSQIELTAIPANGFAFSEWTGACVGQSEVCTIPINGATTTEAVFIESFTLTVSLGGVGSGIVQSNIPGIACGTECMGEFFDGTTVTLNATPNNMVTTFDHWEGACAVEVTATCQLTMDTDKTTQAFFTAPDAMFSDGFED